MFERLQKKWKVNGFQLVFIIGTFAIGGSLTGFVGKKIMNGLGIPQDWIWAIIYILLITLIWPMAVLIISIPMGQFRFFLNYIKKIGLRMGLVKSPRLPVAGTGSEMDYQNRFQPGEIIRIAIFASGTGSNAQKIIDYFKKNPFIKISLIVTDKKKAGVLQIAEAENISSVFIDKEKFAAGDPIILATLKEQQINFIILAGFLRKIPETLIKEFSGRMINIHPALLPRHGGKGMYGHFVHEAVIAAGDKESGITIHYVDEQYDHGKRIFQATCPVLESDTAETLALRVRKLEHEHYPVVIEKILTRLTN